MGNLVTSTSGLPIQAGELTSNDKALINYFFGRLEVIYGPKYRAQFVTVKDEQNAKREFGPDIVKYSKEQLDMKLAQAKDQLEEHEWPNIMRILKYRTTTPKMYQQLEHRPGGLPELPADYKTKDIPRFAPTAEATATPKTSRAMTDKQRKERDALSKELSQVYDKHIGRGTSPFGWTGRGGICNESPDLEERMQKLMGKGW